MSRYGRSSSLELEMTKMPFVLVLTTHSSHLTLPEGLEKKVKSWKGEERVGAGAAPARR